MPVSDGRRLAARATPAFRSPAQGLGVEALSPLHDAAHDAAAEQLSSSVAISGFEEQLLSVDSIDVPVATWVGC